jgi:para-nitrobenzyl esterase
MINAFSFSRSRRVAGLAAAASVFACVPCVLAVRAAGASPGAVVRTAQGSVQGVTVGSVEQFRGVPYAAPPVGDLRWRAPAPPAPYAGGMLQAANFPAPCVQGNAPAGFPPPSEDCLYLNLYRPAGTKEGRKMPVLMYIHGGGFGGGTASARDGSPLASSQDMIVIMINYRLSVLGWLGLAALDAETPNGASSGNYGFLDMVASLRWVQDNIDAFGGDRDNVTIAGTSTGGVSVCALMTAPLRETLFHRAIIESGECTHTSAFIISHQTALSRGASFAAKAGCTDPATFASCLRSKPAAALQAATAGVGTFVANIGGSLIPKAPLQAIGSGEVAQVPVIVGVTHDEQRRNPIPTTGFPATEQTYEKYLTNTFGLLAPLVAAQYPSKGFSDPAYAAGAVASDSGAPNGIGVCPMLVELGAALAKQTKTFAYELNDPLASVVTDPPGFEAGSLHTAEIGFLYLENAPGTRSAEQVQLAARMQRYWGTFARTGRPGDDSQWAPLQTGAGSVLRFQPRGDTQLPTAAMSSEHRCAFWAQVGY